jgi:hypothetical protein
VFNRRKPYVELTFVKNCIELGRYCERTLILPNGEKRRCLDWNYEETGEDVEYSG